MVTKNFPTPQVVSTQKGVQFSYLVEKFHRFMKVCAVLTMNLIEGVSCMQQKLSGRQFALTISSEISSTVNSHL